MSTIAEMVPDQNVLLIEDEEALSSIMKERLMDEGFNVQVASNGYEALQHATEITPNIILLDVLMPRMDGFEFLRRLRKKEGLGDVPVVMLSNLSQELDITTAKQLGAVDFMVKSNFSMDAIVEKVKEHIK